MQKFRVMKSIEFDYGHRIHLHGSKCRNVHGHRGRVEVTVEGPLITDGSSTGMVVDFSAIKSALTDRIGHALDHKLLVCVDDVDFLSVQAVFAYRSIGIGDFARSVGEVPGEVGIPGIGCVMIMEQPPTAENLAYWCYQQLSKEIDKDQVSVISVKFWETPTSVAEYCPARQEPETFAYEGSSFGEGSERG